MNVLLQNDSMQNVANLWSASLGNSVSWSLAAAILIAVIVGASLVSRLHKSSSQVQPTQQQQKQKRNFTSAEVAQHDQKDSLWIILKGKVYDVTPYIDEHPGGSAIFRHGGQDSTEGFFGPQHPERVFDLIDDFYIGDLVE